MPNKQKHVLVVEDEQVLSAVICRQLRTSGYDVTVSSNGVQALNALEQQDFDLIITDHKMPEMDGSEFCRRVRQDERRGDIPIILCTAKTYELDVEQITQELRLSKVISKPFSPKCLTDLVRSLLTE